MRRARRLSWAANQLAMGSSSNARAIVAVSCSRSASEALRTWIGSASRVSVGFCTCVIGKSPPPAIEYAARARGYGDGSSTTLSRVVSAPHTITGMSSTRTFNPPTRILMGPGPSGAHPRVLKAMTAPILGHLDPEFLRIMDDCNEMLRQVMGTTNRITLATPGTGTSGMEAAVMNLVEPGDKVVVGICGYFGERIAQMAERAGGEVTRVQA